MPDSLAVASGANHFIEALNLEIDKIEAIIIDVA